MVDINYNLKFLPMNVKKYRIIFVYTPSLDNVFTQFYD